MTDSEYATPINDTLREAILDAAAETLADIHDDWDREKEKMQVDLDALLAPLKERVAKLEGQVEMLASLLGAGSTDSRAKSKRLKSQDDDSRRLLEAPRTQ
jgi:hypothetical protein